MDDLDVDIDSIDRFTLIVTNRARLCVDVKSFDPRMRVCLDGWRGHFMGRRSKRERACGESEPFSQQRRLVGNELILKYKTCPRPP